MDEPPFKGIMQMAYIVPDLQKAIAHYVDELRIGPWFVSEHFAGTDKLYRGKPTEVDMTIGMSYANQMNIELIQQIGDAPSVYREVTEARGYGFHHWGVATDTFDDDLKRYRTQGYEVAFTTSIRGARLAYVDTTRDLPGMIELIELTPNHKSVFTSWYRACQDWDGHEPIRKRG